MNALIFVMMLSIDCMLIFSAKRIVKSTKANWFFATTLLATIGLLGFSLVKGIDVRQTQFALGGHLTQLVCLWVAIFKSKRFTITDIAVINIVNLVTAVIVVLL